MISFVTLAVLLVLITAIRMVKQQQEEEEQEEDGEGVVASASGRPRNVLHSGRGRSLHAGVAASCFEFQDVSGLRSLGFRA